MEEMSIKIGSFNFKNRPFMKLQKKDRNYKFLLFASRLIDQGFDFVGTQELTTGYVNQLTSLLEEYQFYGDYRYGNLLSKIPYNESNKIITNHKVQLSKTVFLPWIPTELQDFKTALVKMSMMPRIATILITEDNNKMPFCMINTHLDYQIPQLQKRQLKALQKLIADYKKQYPMVITGDFSMDLSDPNFNAFLKSMEEIGISRVPINENTWYGKENQKKILDHIFLSEDWVPLEMGTQSLRGISDHKLLYVKAKQKIKN